MTYCTVIETLSVEPLLSWSGWIYQQEVRGDCSVAVEELLMSAQIRWMGIDEID
jgi:hypothetical protein